MSIVKQLKDNNLISPPKWLPDNVAYETIMGSVAYGASSDTSDMDIYGFCIPPKSEIFPHLKGEIPGFGKQNQHFEQFQQNGIVDKSACAGHGRTYDITIYSVVKYMQLCMDNNPNMIDSLYTSHDCVLHITQVGQMIRDSRDLFLHKGSWHKFRGYAYAQLHKMDNKQPVGKRKQTVDEFGYDVKFAYHIVRLINEVEQILTLHTLDLRRDSEMLKAIRRGEWTLEQVKTWFSAKEQALEQVYASSTLRYKPDESALKTLLLQALEQHYGSLHDAIVINDTASLIDEIETTLHKYKRG